MMIECRKILEPLIIDDLHSKDFIQNVFKRAIEVFASGQTMELCAAATKEVGEDKAVQIANYLCKGNYAVSGSVEGCDVVERIAKPDFKARMTVRLAVAGAFHTRYMQPAVDQLKEALENTEIITPRIPVISNVDAEPHSDPEIIKDILSKQVRLKTWGASFIN